MVWPWRWLSEEPGFRIRTECSLTRTGRLTFEYRQLSAETHANLTLNDDLLSCGVWHSRMHLIKAETGYKKLETIKKTLKQKETVRLGLNISKQTLYHVIARTVIIMWHQKWCLDILCIQNELTVQDYSLIQANRRELFYWNRTNAYLYIFSRYILRIKYLKFQLSHTQHR